jgi:dTMP kinase
MFVVFEGIDGSGKTTLSNLVAARLRDSGLSVKHLRADGRFASSVSEALRDLGRDARHLTLTPEAEFFLYAARDVQLIAEVLKPALTQVDVVIADRFLFTPEVLGRSGRGLSDELTAPVLRAASLGVVPDLVVLVDVEPTLARARRKAAKLVGNDARPPSRKGLAGVGLQHRLRRGYLELAARDPERWAVVDNEGTLELTVRRLVDLVEDARRRGGAPALARFGARAPKPRAVSPDVFDAEQALATFLAWVDRRAELEPRTAAYLLGGLAGPGVDRRRRLLAATAPEVVLSGLSGLADDVSFELRVLLARSHPRAVARSLAGLGAHPQAVAMRSALEGEALAEVAGTLGKLDDEASWSLRERAFEQVPEAVVAALGGISGARGWRLREAFVASVPELSKSYEASRTVARSVTSLPDDRAWELREQAREAAPVAALSAVGSLLDERAFRWREQFATQAPKVVMETLRRVDDPRAWALRRALAAECKEVVDSLHGMDQEAAWELREELRDVWPSTVVKSLGVHADGARGRALLERQLERHPQNLSLLKHAAAIALGLHRRPETAVAPDAVSTRPLAAGPPTP